MPNKCAYKAPLHFLYDLKWNHWQIKTTDCICVFQMGIHTNRNLKHFLYNTANHDNLVVILTGYRVNDGDVRSQCQKETQILNLLTASRQALGSSKFHIWWASMACGERNYKSSNTHYSFAWFIWPHCLSSPHLLFLICISKCCQVSGVFRLCCLGDRRHSWPGTPVSGICQFQPEIHVQTRQRKEMHCYIEKRIPEIPIFQSTKFQFFKFFVSQNPLNWPKWSSHHTRNFTDSDSSVFVKKFLHSIHIFIHFAWCGYPECSQSSKDITPLPNLKNHS